MISYLAVAVISAATLAYEVLLVRLFAIVQWHHFAFMAISIALLGFGASDRFLADGTRQGPIARETPIAHAARTSLTDVEGRKLAFAVVSEPHLVIRPGNDMQASAHWLHPWPDLFQEQVESGEIGKVAERA
jgi:hypothetical protein